MATVAKNAVGQYASFTGTGAVTLAGAALEGGRTFAAYADGTAGIPVMLQEMDGDGARGLPVAWEYCQCTYDAAAGTLTRGAIYASSNSGAPVNFSAGLKRAFVSLPAEDVGGATDAVLFTAQTLTSPQKVQATTNIDAATVTALASGLAGKASASHTHLYSALTGLPTFGISAALNVAALPSATAYPGVHLAVIDDAGGPCSAYSYGGQWLRTRDNVLVATSGFPALTIGAGEVWADFTNPANLWADSAGTILAANNGNVVAVTSGSGLVQIASTGGAETARSDALNGVIFDDQHGINLSDNQSQCSIVWVFGRYDLGGFLQMFGSIFGAGLTSAEWCYILTYAGKLGFTDNLNNQYAASASKWYLRSNSLVFTYNAGAFYIYVNGGLAISGTAGLAQFRITQLATSSNGSTQGHQCSLFQGVGYFRRVLTAGERGQVDAWHATLRGTSSGNFIALAGDSVTSGVRAKANTYSKLVALNYPNSDLACAAVSGGSYLNSSIVPVTAYASDYSGLKSIVLLAGINDFTAARTASQVRAATDAYIAAHSNFTIAVCTIPIGPYFATPSSAATECANFNAALVSSPPAGATVIDLSSLVSNTDFSDQVHPNEAGEAKIYALVKTWLDNRGHL